MSAHADKVLAAVESDRDTSPLASSWRRCHRLYDIDPDRETTPETDATGLRDARERNADLIQVARPHIEHLFRLLCDVQCAVFIADRHAMMIEVRTNRAHDTWHRPPNQWVGTVYSEKAFGTNSIGTCLVEDRGVILRGGQHYLGRYADRVCISAPLHGPDGKLAGCLVLNENAEAHDARLDMFLSITVSTIARHIERQLFALAHPGSRLLLAAADGSQPCALLAVDRDDCVVGATSSARRLLALDDQAIDSTPALDSLYETRAIATATLLEESELRMIRRAMARHGGNVSAAARSVGISRSTLYRKLARLEA